MSFFGRIRASLLAASLLMIVSSSGAAIVDITATYDESGDRRFVNTTPMSGFCADNACKPGEVTVMTPLSVNKVWMLPSRNHVNHQYADGEVKTVELSHVSGAKAQMSFRINMLGRKYVRGTRMPGAIFNFKEGDLGDVVWVAPAGVDQGACRARPGRNQPPEAYSFAWSVPPGRTQCSANSRYPLATGSVLNPELGPYEGRIEDISVGYELTFPDGSNMLDGDYTGRVTYRVGVYGEISFSSAGNLPFADAYNDKELTFVFTLRVRHKIKVGFPAGTKMVLQPPGGWAKWVNTGIDPPSLKASLPFTLSGGGAEIKVQLSKCAYGNGFVPNCWMTNVKPGRPEPGGRGTRVIFGVYMTLPGWHRSDGSAVDRLEIQYKRPTTIYQGASRNNARGTLSVEALPDSLKDLVRASGPYRGNFTLMIESVNP